uniref:DUF5641 domain-containing protein n=1 Tax=Strigamia maritima TaxID=126957 RepID=T1J7V8_STRMM
MEVTAAIDQPSVASLVPRIPKQGQPRMTWKLARVTNTFLGRDNLIRSCELTLPNGKQLRRPIQRLCLMEA